MKCYIRTIDRKTKLVPCYKTKYKNVVIVKVEEKSYVDIYSITHYPTGIALSYDRFVSKEDAFESVDKIVENVRKSLNKNNMTIKQYCINHNLERIN